MYGRFRFPGRRYKQLPQSTALHGLEKIIIRYLSELLTAVSMSSDEWE